MEDFMINNFIPLGLISIIILILVILIRHKKEDEEYDIKTLKLLIFSMVAYIFDLVVSMIVSLMYGGGLGGDAFVVLIAYFAIILIFIKTIESIISIIKGEETSFNLRTKKFLISMIAILIVSFIGNFVIIESYNMNAIVADLKPIIYLYPTEETNITVTLGYPEELLCVYPEYKSCWNVLAKPSGDLVDLNTGRNLYSLYYESNDVVDYKVEKDGFIVKGEDVAEFLEEKLTILGLNDREKEEFIIYWLPRMQENKYNYIRFATEEEINENMPLEFSVEPDSLIRILMTFKGLDKPISVEEQKLVTPSREGFTVVEWGGTEIK